MQTNLLTSRILCAALLLSVLAGAVFAAGVPMGVAEKTKDSEKMLVPNGPTHPLRTWAVLASDDVRKSGLEDLIMTGMTADRTLTLVERKRLDLVTQELSLIDMTESAASADRRRVGQLVKADALVIVSRQSADGRDLIRLVICDTYCGARLSDDYIVVELGKIDAAADKVLAAIFKIRRRFSAGVQIVFGVPPFVSLNLTHQYDYLQRGFASLLTRTLSKRKGVAVVEVEEAKQIAREINLAAGNDIRRLVPLFVEGEFEVVRPPDGGQPTVSFRIRVVGASGGDLNLPERTVALADAAKYVGVELSTLVSGAGEVEIANPMTNDQQATATVERAEAFARLAAFEHSTELREAALLLEDNAEQRCKLIREYCRIIDSGWARGTVVGSEQYLAIIRERAECWQTTLAHLEYLIRNQQIMYSEAIDLTELVLFSPQNIRIRPNEAMAALDQARRRFLREVYPLTCSLKNVRLSSKWSEVLINYTFFSYDVDNYLNPGPEEMDFRFEIFTQVLPTDIVPSHRVIACFYGFATMENPKPQMVALVNRLAVCDRPILRILVRYAFLCRRWCHERAKLDLPAFQKEVKALSDDWHLLESTLKRDASLTELSSNISDLEERVELALKPRIPRPIVPSHKPNWAFETEPIEIKVKTLGGDVVPVRDKVWRAPGGFGCMEHLLNCGDNIDVFWQNGAIAIMRQKGLLEEILLDQESFISDVKWDGRNLWVASRYAGISIISLDGTVIARLGEQDGLPPADREMLVRPVEPGKALIAGALDRKDSRLWLAMAQYDGPHAQVEVIHKAIGQETEQDVPNIYERSCPLWTQILEPTDKTTPRVVLIGRAGRLVQPLQVDLSTLKVSLYPEKINCELYDDACFSWGGKLYVAGQDGQLLFHNGQLYELSRLRCYHVDLDTGQRIEIGPNPWHRADFGVSVHYGIISWDRDDFVKVIFRSVSETVLNQSTDVDLKTKIPNLIMELYYKHDVFK